MANAPDPVDDLFVVPPEEFVAARNALVKQLRAGGDRERAAEVAALRRPSVPDWALNVVAHGQGAELGPFFEAAQESREAQRAAASGREGVDLRGALQGLRGASEAVVKAALNAVKGAGKATGALSAPVSTRLQEVAASAGLSDQLRQGRLGTGGAEADDLFDGVEPTTRSRTARSGPPRSARGEQARASTTQPIADLKTETKGTKPDLKRRRQLEKDLTAADRAQAKAERSRDGAATSLAAAEQHLTEAEAALVHATAERDLAVERCEAARAALDAASSDLEQTEADLADAEAALAAEAE
jgi:hypothetical protein